VTLGDGKINQEFDLEMVFKDNIFYLKDPITRQWQKKALAEEDSRLFREAVNQSVNNQVYYTELINKASQEGVFRNITFAGEKTIDGVKTKGIYIEVNGLKIGKLLKEYLANAGTMEGIDTEELNKAFEEVFSGIVIDKFKATYWVGMNDKLMHGYNGEVRYKMSIPASEDKKEEICFEMSFDMTLKDLNKPQNIVAPEVSETPAGKTDIM